MPVTLLYIGDSLVDLFPNTVISTNISRAEVGAIASRSVTYTNSLSTPNTKNNCALFGFPFEVNSNSSIPYTLRIGRYIVDGITILPQAVIQIVSAENNLFKLRIYENVYDFYLNIKGKTLRELDIITPSAWTPAGIDSARNTTSGIVSAIVDWNNPSGAVFQSSFFLPSFYYHTFVTATLELTGLDPEGSILTDDDFLELIIPYFNDSFEYPEDFYSQFNTLNILGSGVPATNQVNAEAIVVGENFTAASHGTFQAFFSVGGITWNGGTNLIGRIKKNGVTVASGTIATNPAPGGLLTITYEDFFDVGDIVDMVVYSDDMSAPGTDYTRVANSFLQYTADGLVNPDLVVWNQLLTGLSCQDLLKDFYVRFGIIDRVEDNRLILKTIEEIISDRAGALDWTDKLVEKTEVLFTTEFAQENYFEYKDVIGDETSGRGSISISNSNLKDSNTFFSSVFGNSETRTKNDLILAKIPVFASDSADIYDFDNNPEVRLLTIKDRDTEGSITFNGTPRTDYKIGYFTDNTKAKDTGMQYFIDNYYGGYSRSLQKSKAVTKFFLLLPQDIKDYNQHKMIFVTDSYYLVNKIIGFVPGKITKVELFKVG